MTLLNMAMLTQAWLVLDYCISHNHFGAFIQFPLEDLLLVTEICRASTLPLPPPPQVAASEEPTEEEGGGRSEDGWPSVGLKSVHADQLVALP